VRTLEATSWWTKAGVRSIEYLATLTGRRQTALADHEECHWHSCCCLAHSAIPTSTCFNRCDSASGFHLRAWLCCSGGRIFTCGECIRSRYSDCVSGPSVDDYLCSYYEREAFSC
jgi:hypothetical protein